MPRGIHGKKWENYLRGLLILKSPQSKKKESCPESQLENTYILDGSIISFDVFAVFHTEGRVRSRILDARPAASLG